MGDKVGVLNNGRLAQVGTPYEIYHHPRDTYVAGFVGSPAMNLLAADLLGDRMRIPSGAIEFAVSPALRARLGRSSGPVTLGIRAENVHLDPAGLIEARVWGFENHGVEKIVTLKTGDCLFKATMPASIPTAIDEPMRLTFDQSRLHAFDAATGRNLSQEGRELAAAE